MSQEKVLMKHNDLVSAKYETKITQNKIFTYLLYAFQKHSSLNNSEGSLEYIIKREELAKLIGKTTDQTVKGLINILLTLRKKDLYLMEELGDGSTDYIAGGFIDNAIYNDTSDTFTITASKRVHNLLQRYLDDGYTPINLEIWLSLNNKYAQRFYDLLRMWSGTKGKINYKVAYLRKILMLETKYKQYPDFRKRVIEPAINELNSTGFFEIMFQENRVGRNVESIDFIVRDLDKRKYYEKHNTIEIKDMAKNENKGTVEGFKDENNTKTKQEEIKTLKDENKEFFIPDEEVFNFATKRLLKKHFKDYDFTLPHLNEAFEESVAITMERDDVETIEMKSYKFFKGTLNNKIVEYEEEYKKDLEHQKNMDKYW